MFHPSTDSSHEPQAVLPPRAMKVRAASKKHWHFSGKTGDLTRFLPATMIKAMVVQSKYHEIVFFQWCFSVISDFLEVYKLLLVLSQGCKLEPSLYQFSVGPHPPFRVSFWCVCVRGRGSMHVLSHPDILTKSWMFSNTVIPYALICDEICNERADGSGTPGRCLQIFPERCRHEEESQRQGHQTLGHSPWHHGVLVKDF